METATFRLLLASLLLLGGLFLLWLRRWLGSRIPPSATVSIGLGDVGILDFFRAIGIVGLIIGALLLIAALIAYG